MDSPPPASSAPAGRTLAEPPILQGLVLSMDGAALPGARLVARTVPKNFEMMESLLSGQTRPVAASSISNQGGRLHLELPAPGLWRLTVEAPGFLSMQLATVPVVADLVLPEVRLARAKATEIHLVPQQGGKVDRVGVFAESAAGSLWNDPTKAPWRLAPRFGRTQADGHLTLLRGTGESLDLWLHLPSQGWAQQARLQRSGRIPVGRGSGIRAQLEVTTRGGEPVSGAIISTRGKAWPLVRTGASGRVHLTASTEGAQWLVFAPGGRHGILHLEAGETVARLALPETQPLQGRVTTPSGQPVPNALVWISTEPADAVSTDPEGRFQVRRSAASKSRLLLHHADFRPASRTIEASRHPEEVSIRLLPTAQIRGRLVDREGHPLAGAAVAAIGATPQGDRASGGTNRGRWARIPRDEADSRAYTDRKGEFLLAGLSPGTTYLLQANKRSYGQTQQQVVVHRPGLHSDPVELRLSQGRVAFGRILDLDRRPIADAVVTASPSSSGSTAVPSPAKVMGISNPRGHFELAEPPGGRIDLHAAAPGYGPLVVRGLEIPPGMSPVDLGSLLLDPGATLVGQVTNPTGQSVPEVSIWVRKSSESKDRFALTAPSRPSDSTTDAQGRFEIQGLAVQQPADLWLGATGYQPRLVLGVLPPDPSFEGLSPEGEPGEVALLEVRLFPGARAMGSVVSQSGEPIQAAEVRLRTIEGANPGVPPGSLEQIVRTDSLGRFECASLVPGVVEIDVRAEGFVSSPVHRHRVVTGGQLEELRFTLGPGAVIEGWIVDPELRPVPRADVRIGDKSSQSQDDGHFRLTGVALGHHLLEVEHRHFNASRLEVEAGTGTPPWEIVLQPAVAVSGKVVNPDGLPLAAVEIRLENENSSGLGQSASSDTNGRFHFPAVADGRHRLRAHRAGYVALDSEMEVTIEGVSVTGVEVRLQAGGTLAGQVLGLDFEQLAGVRVVAEGVRKSQAGEVDYEGHFRVENLSPGDYRLVATTLGGSRQAKAFATLETGQLFAEQDLEFQAALTLRGLVVASGEPLPETSVTVRDRERFTTREVQTDFEGRFVLEDLEPGAKRIELANHRYGVVDNRNLDLQGDRDLVLEITTATLAGTVLESTRGEPVSSAAIVLRQLLGRGEESSTFAVNSDHEGRFLFQRLPQGSFRLTLQHDGFLPLERQIRIDRESPEEMTLELERAAGLEVSVSLETGGTPSLISLAGRSHSGQAFRETRQTLDGKAFFSTLAAGTWDLVVAGPGGAARKARVEVPGEPLVVALPAAGRLRVRIPELVATEDTATLTILDPHQEPLVTLPPGGSPLSSWRVVSGNALVENVPAGAWRVEARSVDGRTWAGTAVTTGGPDVGVELP
ncbi:MAG: carboxypeptidase regulatory-like domain-containing protein [Deltaproteobacteria bacterium]|nr:carboxypeptidase regulatory-like domain-containing protein [Deltaproteobacteria bacterium]